MENYIMNKFHRKCGDRVTLLNQNLTAIRNFVEFNHGLILSAEPLTDDALFEVRIDRKVNVWNGSLEIGVTTLDPEILELPATATKLRNTAWILSGNSLVKDGVTIVNSYGPELDSLQEGDCLAVSRSCKGELMFFINGRCLGIAVKDLPARLFAVIDLYGQCVQVSIIHSNYTRSMMDQPYEGTSSEAGACSPPRLHRDTHIQMPLSCPLVSQDNLRFHPRCGILVKLSNNNKSAERARPLDDYNNGVVMTHRPLYDNEFFEIRIDKLVDKWSGSIEVGVTAHNPATIRFPSTMTNMDTGTIMMSGCKVLMNGQGACMEYGNFNLDELREGDTVGMMRKGSGKLHYFINGVDQGVATDKVPPQVWGVVDLYGMTVKVTVVDPCEDLDSNINAMPLRMLAPAEPELAAEVSPDTLPNLPQNGPMEPPAAPTNGPPDSPPDAIPDLHQDATPNLPPEGITASAPGASPETSVQMPAEDLLAEPSTSSYVAPGCTGLVEEDQLLFHTLRDSHVIIINDGRTAHRPNAFEIFNNGFVMTNRTLKTNELFQVRLDLVIPKWAGSIEIGVTQHSSNDIKFPFRMINATSGTWGITGEDVIRDGVIIIPQYVRNLSRLVEGDSVGVMRKDMGILHFYVNGVDQGPAAFNIPEHVFGIVDLYGRVAQATIVDTYMPLPISSPESPVSCESNATVLPEMCFHRVHGHNARLSRNRLTASRATVYSEFNDAVLFSSRPLRECDMFEIRIDKMVDCWIGSLEIGVTAIRPDDLDANGGLGILAGTATDLSWDTYILSGSAMMKDGECVRSGYPLDLDTLTVGSRVGMMWHADRSLHYYMDGMDMGKAWYVPHLNIYAVVDLYGQCTQVTILQNEERAFNYNGCNTDHGILANPRVLPTPPPPYWSFSEYHGDNVTLSKDYTIARRLTPDPMGALVFSSAHLIVNELYEIQILECRHSYAGNFRMGVTDVNVLNANINRHLPLCASWLPHFTAYIDGKFMKYSRTDQTGEKDLHSFVPSFEWLRPGDRIGLKKTPDSKVLVYYNSELLEVAFEKVPDKVYVLMELYGTTTKIQTVSRGTNIVPNQQTIPNDKPEDQIAGVAGPSCVTVDMSDADTKIAPEMVKSDETSGALAVGLPTESPPTPPQSDLPDDTSPQTTAPVAVPDEENACALPVEEENACALPPNTDKLPVDEASTSSSTGMAEVVRQRRGALPYTFHFMTGNNIRLCSSDTVALRFRGYSDAVAVASQPLHRGMAFRFRVDKVTDVWEGTVCIGALGMLPTEMPPSTALHFNMPCWTLSDIGRKLEEVTENSVLTLHFRFNSELTLEIDGVFRGVIATIPRRFNDIYPAIDLYGRVVQVSILLHPHVILGGTSLDLPMIEENHEDPEEPAARADDENDFDSDGEADPDVNGDANPYAYANADYDINDDLTPSDDEQDEFSFHRGEIRAHGHNYSDPIVHYDENSIDDYVDSTIADDDNSNANDDPISNTLDDSNSVAVDDFYSNPIDDLSNPIDDDFSNPINDVSNMIEDSNNLNDDDISNPIEDYSNPIEEGSNMIEDPSNSIEDASNTLDDANMQIEESSYPIDDSIHPIEDVSQLSEGLYNPVDLASNPIDDESILLLEVQETQATGEIYMEVEPMPGPSSAPDDLSFLYNSSDVKNLEIKESFEDDSHFWTAKESLHQSLQLDEEYIDADNDLAAETRGLKKSQSIQLFSQNHSGTQPQDGDDPDSDSDDSSSADSLINPLSLGSHILDDDSDSPDEIEDTCDTNIRHNDQYPEANEMNDSNDGYDASDAIDDNFDNVFIDAMFLETTNMPDLNEEQSLSVDESTTTRRDDYWADGLTVENLHYLNGIICWDQRVTGARVEHRDWVFYSETNGNCEVMHLALKFWNQIVAPYADMREVVTSGNVHCFCNNCHPDADPLYTGKQINVVNINVDGWVRIERAKAQEVACSQPVRMYWHVMRATITSALALTDVTEMDMRRPRHFCPEPSTSPACADTWIDEEGKPHQAALALDVDVGGQDAESDRLIAYWIYLKSHASMMQEAIEEFEDTVEDTVDDILEDAVDDFASAILDDTLEDNASDLAVAVALMDDAPDLDDDESELEPTE